MSRPDYKGPGRRETARRVRERSEGFDPSGLDEALTDRIEREKQIPPSPWRVACQTCGTVHRGRCPQCFPELQDEALKVPGPSSGGNQDREPDTAPTERGSEGA